MNSQLITLLLLLFLVPQLLKGQADERSLEERFPIYHLLAQNNHQTVEERIALYHRLKEEQPTKYDFDNESDLNNYGYSLLYSDQQEEAIPFFQLLSQEFPKSGRPFDSMAEAFLKFGDREKAIVNFKKSLTLDPDNQNATYKIKLLGGELDLLAADTSWGKEIFQLPLRFAPEITYSGGEEARFPPEGWSDTAHPFFWTYVFAWRIDSAVLFTEALLESDLQKYFDGLMDVNEPANKGKRQKTTAVFVKDRNEDKLTTFRGKISVFDRFTTQAPMILNVLAEVTACPEKERTLVLFHYSPQSFGHEVWNELKGIELLTDLCDR